MPNGSVESTIMEVCTSFKRLVFKDVGRLLARRMVVQTIFGHFWPISLKIGELETRATISRNTEFWEKFIPRNLF